MPKAVKRLSAKIAPSPPIRARRARVRKSAAAPVRSVLPQKNGARILTREEVMANQPPLPPGAENGWEWFCRVFRPLREYNAWLIKSGHPEGLGELDASLRERRHI